MREEHPALRWTRAILDDVKDIHVTWSRWRHATHHDATWLHACDVVDTTWKKSWNIIHSLLARSSNTSIIEWRCTPVEMMSSITEVTMLLSSLVAALVAIYCLHIVVYCGRFAAAVWMTTWQVRARNHGRIAAFDSERAGMKWKVKLVAVIHQSEILSWLQW